MGGILKLVTEFLSVLNIFGQNAQRSEDQASGARKGELDRRDKSDEIRASAKKIRKIDNSATDSDVTDRL